jgi:hypothetical protein
MNRSLIKSRSVRPANARSRAQTRFDRLFREVEQWRERLSQWQAFEGPCMARISQELEPLEVRYRVRCRDMAFLIDELLVAPPVGRPLGRQQRARLVGLLTSLAASVLRDAASSAETDEDEALKALHDRYHEESFDAQNEAAIADTQQMLASFGVEISADELRGLSLPEMLAKVAGHLFEEGETEAQQQAAAETERRSTQSPNPARDRRAAAAEAKREQAEREVSQSVREVYRKLVSALHPDRETDPQERERKTALMQRVNQAYDARDLLTLLTLQIETEQISAADLTSAPDRRIEHYNQVLAEQCEELSEEVMGYVYRFGMVLPEHLPPDPKIVTPQLVEQLLGQDIQHLRGKIASLEADLVGFRDRKYLGAWLKGLR